MSLTRRDFLRAAMGAALAVPLSRLPLFDDEPFDIEAQRRHARWLLEMGDEADQDSPFVARGIRDDIPAMLEAHHAFADSPEQLEYASTLIRYLYGRRAKGLTAWPEDARRFFERYVVGVEEHES